MYFVIIIVVSIGIIISSFSNGVFILSPKDPFHQNKNFAHYNNVYIISKEIDL